MGTNRLVNTDVFTSADLIDQPAWVRLLWIGMICFADQTGYVTASEVALNAKVLSGLRIRPHRIRTALDTLATRRCIASEIVEGVKYYRLTNFSKFQRFKRQKEGKGREGSKEKEEKKDSSEQPIQSVVLAPPPELLELELYRKNKKLLESFGLLMITWKQAYPGVNLLAELKKAHAWEVANPKRRKVDKVGFLQRWMARAQDKGGITDERSAIEDFVKRTSNDNGMVGSELG